MIQGGGLVLYISEIVLLLCQSETLSKGETYEQLDRTMQGEVNWVFKREKERREEKGQ